MNIYKDLLKINLAIFHNFKQENFVFTFHITMFYLLLLIILFCQLFFTRAFFLDGEVWAITLAVLQLISFLLSVVVMIRFFSRRKAENLKVVATSMGVMIASFVPVLVSFPLSTIYLLSENEYVFGVLLFVFFSSLIAILVGVFWGRWNWKVHPVNLTFDNLPKEMDGVQIVQISDVHVGSFFNRYLRVEKAIAKINELNPDYVLFTGDLVNNLASEMKGWEPVFSKIQAKKGKYSILGNHDYGDYVTWENDHAKIANLEALIQMHRAIDFVPLLNESVELSPDFWLLGVENWGKPPFRQSGELAKALQHVPEKAFKILLSHDPSHFDEQVVQKTSIELTLSGHTHGMQFGIERFGIKFSPVSFRYKKWAGLYQENGQYLYVNRGFGFLGFPGRVGIYPEITLFTLRCKSTNSN